MKKTIINLQYKNVIFLTLLISFACIFLYSLWCGEREMLGDASNYWNLSKSFDTDYGFSLLNFSKSFRGYLFPLILYFFRAFGSFMFGSEWIGFAFCNSIVIAFILVLFPVLMFKVKNHIRIIFGGIAITLIFIYFWKSFLLYALSDLYALMLFAVIIMILSFIKVQKKSVIFFFILGICYYSAYNIRTVYKIPLVLISILFIIFEIRYIKEYFPRIVIGIISFILGFILIAVPQYLINSKNYNRSSISVITDETFGVDLSLQQLYWGVYMQRYETNVESIVGSEVTYPAAAVRFIDDSGMNLFSKFNNEEYSYSNYIKMLLNSPLDTVGIYTRHLVNSMNLLYRDVYIENMNSGKSVIFLLNFVIVVLGGIAVILNKNALKQKYLIFFVIPAILAVPGAVEVRFSLPTFLMLYYAISYSVKWNDLKLFVNKNLYALIFIVVLLFGLCCSVIGNTLINGEFGQIQFGGL